MILVRKFAMRHTSQVDQNAMDVTVCKLSTGDASTYRTNRLEHDESGHSTELKCLGTNITRKHIPGSADNTHAG
jgi:hypothetical protein